MNVNVTLNGQSLPVELVAMVATVFSGNTVDMDGNTRTGVTIKERGENLRAMAGEKAFVDWISKQQGEFSVTIESPADDDESDGKTKVFHVLTKNFIPFLKNQLSIISAKEASKTLCSVEYIGDWGKRGRTSTRESAESVLTRGLAALTAEK